MAIAPAGNTGITNAGFHLVQVFSPFDYGAVGDNVTNDYTAVQACITASAGLGIVLLDKMFFSKSRLSIPSNVEIVGLGWSTGLRFDWLLSSQQSTYLLNSDVVNGNTKLRFRDFTIQGAYAGIPLPASPAQVSGLLIRRGTDVVVENVRFYRIPAISCSLQGVSRGRMSGNFVYQGGRDGLACRAFDGTACEDMLIEHNIIREVGDDAIAISAEGDIGFGPVLPKRVQVVGNTVFGNSQYYANGAGRGIFLYGGEDIDVVGNNIADTFASGISLSSDNALPAININISDNIVRRAGIVGDGTQPRVGLRAVGPFSNVRIANNTIDSAVQYGMQISDNSEAARTISDVEIVNNTVTRCGTVATDYGIWVASAFSGSVKRVSVKQNKVYNNNGGGISHQGSTDVFIEDNLVVDNGGATTGATDVNASGIISSGVGFAPTVTIKNNRCYDTRGGSAKQSYGVVFATTAGAVADATVESNILSGNRTAAFQINQAPTLLVRRGNRLSTGVVHGQVAMVNGTVTVNTTEVLAADSIFLTRVVGAGTTRGTLSVGTIVAGTSFVIRSEDLAGALSADDDSTVFWEIRH